MNARDPEHLSTLFSQPQRLSKQCQLSIDRAVGETSGLTCRDIAGETRLIDRYKPLMIEAGPDRFERVHPAVADRPSPGNVQSRRRRSRQTGCAPVSVRRGPRSRHAPRDLSETVPPVSASWCPCFLESACHHYSI